MSSTDGLASANFTELTVEIVAAYVANNSVQAANLPALIESVYTAVSGLTQPAKPASESSTPAVNPKRSIQAGHIVCLEDGKTFKSLKRHLRTDHGLTPDEYRTKWGLPRDYPMVAPEYAAKRSALAKKMGFGKKRKAAPSKAKRGKA